MQNNRQIPAESPHSKNDASLETSDMVDGSERPLGVYVVSFVVGLEALALGVAGVWSVISMFTQPIFSLASAIFLSVLLLGLAVGLSAVALNAYRGFRWTRSAAFVWQLLMVAIATPTLLEGNIALGLVLLLPPLAVAFFLFTPKVVAFSLRAGTSNKVL
ncbi:MAG: hypothetical protein Q4P21_00120 [Arthrobacter sp.]|nr:hypothetical protein [Arthrobacter sp.]